MSAERLTAAELEQLRQDAAEMGKAQRDAVELHLRQRERDRFNPYLVYDEEGL